MAFQPVVDTVEIDILYTLNGETAQNVLYAELPGGYILADLVALAAQIDVQVNGTWKPQQPPEAVYVRTEVRGLAVPNDLIATDNTNAGAGTFGASTLPNNVTFVVKKESGLTGRSARGRLYWIGIPFTQMQAADENRLVAAYVTAVVAAVDSQRTGILAVGAWLPVLVSRFAEGIPRTTGLTFNWVSSTNVDDRVDTQRNRLPA